MYRRITIARGDLNALLRARALCDLVYKTNIRARRDDLRDFAK